MQVLEEPLGDLVRSGGAARAPGLPVGAVHEVVHDQLTATLEQVEEVHGAVGALERVVLVDLHHRQVAPLGVEGVALGASVPSPSPAAPCGLGATLRGSRSQAGSCGSSSVDAGRRWCRPPVSLQLIGERRRVPWPRWRPSTTWRRSRSICRVSTEGDRHGGRVWDVGGKTFAWERGFSKADLRRFGETTPPTSPIVAVRVDDLGEKEAVLGCRAQGLLHDPALRRLCRRADRAAPRRQAGRARGDRRRLAGVCAGRAGGRLRGVASPTLSAHPAIGKLDTG